MEKQYAQAIFNLSQREGAHAAEIVRALRAHLKEVGREKLLPRILRELKRIEARTQSLVETFEVASEHEKKHAQIEAKELGVTTDPVINHTLVTGWRSRTGSRVIDRSGKRALLELYRRIASHA